MVHRSAKERQRKIQRAFPDSRQDSSPVQRFEHFGRIQKMFDTMCWPVSTYVLVIQ